MDNEIEQLAEQHGMTVEFVAWFFSEKKAACGSFWLMMMSAMWEGWKGRCAESTAALATIEKCREITGCPAGIDLQDWVKRLAAERDEALNAERIWEKTMVEVCGEDGPASVASEIRSLQALRDTAMQALKSQVGQLAAENVGLKGVVSEINDDLYGKGFQVAGWHLNGALEPLDTWFEDNNWNPETPATDRIIAEAEAQGAEAYETALLTSDDDDFTYEASIFVEETHQLREGAK
ncbi:TPA: hypothetical protein ACTW1M_002835 [Raoultella ornithinolytica]